LPEIAGIGDVDHALIKEAEDTETRHNFLATQLVDLDKAAKDLDILIREESLTKFTRTLDTFESRCNYSFVITMMILKEKEP